MGIGDNTVNAEVDFQQKGGFGGCYKGVHYDGQYLYATHYQGMSIFDISDPAHPEEIGFILTTGAAYGLWVEGEYAYIGNGYESLVIVDISDRTDPVIVGEVDNEWFAGGVTVDGDFAYLADGYFQAQNEGGLLIFDVSDKTDPTFESKLVTNGGPNEVVVEGDYAYVADGQGGLVIVDISDKGNPQLEGFFDTSYACDLAVRGNYAYVADRSGGLVIIDITYTQFPVQAGSYDTEGEAWGIDLVGDYAYIADEEHGLVIIDVSNPNVPVEVGNMTTGDLAMKVVVADDIAYIADNTNGLFIAEVAEVTDPEEIGHFDTAGFIGDVTLHGGYAFVCDGHRLFILDVLGVDNLYYPELVGFYDTGLHDSSFISQVVIEGDYAYMTNGEQGLIILDVSDPQHPEFIGRFDSSGNATGVDLDGNYAFIADRENGLVIVDISDKTNPLEVGHNDTEDWARVVVVEGDYAYVGDRFNGLLIYDVTDRSTPEIIGHFDTDGHVTGIAISGDYAYLSDGDNGLVILDISDKTNPQQVGDHPTEGWSMLAVTVIGNHALLGDNTNGVVILNITDPTDPEVEGHYDTPDTSSTIALSGEYALVADRYNGLVIGEVTGLVPETPVAIISSISPDPAYTTDTVTFRGEAMWGTGEYDTFVWSSSIDGVLYNGSQPEFETDGLSIGDHIITFRLRDTSGKWSAPVDGSLSVMARPMVTVDSPQNESEVSGLVEIRGSASDEDGTVELVEVSFDGETWYETQGTDDWQYNWDTSQVDDGVYDIKIRAWDDHQNTGSFFLELEVANEDTTYIMGRITDRSSGDPVEGAEVLLSGGLDYSGETTEDGAYRIDCEPGEYSLIVRHEDFNKLRADVVIETGKNTFDGELIILTAIDGFVTEGSGKGGGDPVEGAEISLMGENEYSTQSDEDGYYYLECEPGDYDLVVTAEDFRTYDDSLTISEGSTTIDVVLVPDSVDMNEPPRVYITSPLNGTTFSGILMIQGTASDEDGSITQVEISLQGGSWIRVQGTDNWYYEWESGSFDDGEYVLSIRSFDGEDYSGETKLTVSLQKGDSDDGDDDKTVILAVGISVVIIIGLFAGGMFFMRTSGGEMDQGSGRGSGGNRCPACEGEGQYSDEYDDFYCWQCGDYFDELS